VIQKQLIDRLALALLQGEVREGDSVRVDVADGELVLEKAGAVATAARRPCAAAAGWRGRPRVRVARIDKRELDSPACAGSTRCAVPEPEATRADAQPLTLSLPAGGGFLTGR
jgi:hypothetical protein